MSWHIRTASEEYSYFQHSLTAEGVLERLNRESNNKRSKINDSKKCSSSTEDNNCDVAHVNNKTALSVQFTDFVALSRGISNHHGDIVPFKNTGIIDSIAFGNYCWGDSDANHECFELALNFLAGGGDGDGSGGARTGESNKSAINKIRDFRYIDFNDLNPLTMRDAERIDCALRSNSTSGGNLKLFTIGKCFIDNGAFERVINSVLKHGSIEELRLIFIAERSLYQVVQNGCLLKTNLSNSKTKNKNNKKKNKNNSTLKKLSISFHFGLYEKLYELRNHNNRLELVAEKLSFDLGEIIASNINGLQEIEVSHYLLSNRGRSRLLASLQTNSTLLKLNTLEGYHNHRRQQHCDISDENSNNHDHDHENDEDKQLQLCTRTQLSIDDSVRLNRLYSRCIKNRQRLLLLPTPSYSSPLRILSGSTDNKKKQNANVPFDPDNTNLLSIILSELERKPFLLRRFLQNYLFLYLKAQLSFGPQQSNNCCSLQRLMGLLAQSSSENSQTPTRPRRQRRPMGMKKQSSRHDTRQTKLMPNHREKLVKGSSYQKGRGFGGRKSL